MGDPPSVYDVDPQEVIRLLFYRLVEARTRKLVIEDLGVSASMVDFLRYGHRVVTIDYLARVAIGATSRELFAKLSGLAQEMATTGVHAPRSRKEADAIANRSPTSPSVSDLAAIVAARDEAAVPLAILATLKGDYRRRDARPAPAVPPSPKPPRAPRGSRKG